jgi:hypothetical protein
MPPVLLILWISGGGWSDGGYGISVSESEAPFSGGGPWRMKSLFAGDGKDGVTVDLFYLRALRFASLPRLCWCWRQRLHRAWEVCLPTCEIGLVLVPTSYGGLLPLLGVLLFGGAGWFLVETSDPSISDEEMASSHHARPGRSATTTHVSASDVRLLVPFKNFNIPALGRWLASLRLLRPSATRKTGSFLQGPGCNFFFFQRCLCKIWDVNYHICM